MSLSKFFIIISVVLFGSIAVLGVMKKNKEKQAIGTYIAEAPYEIEVEEEVVYPETIQSDEERSSESAGDRVDVRDEDRIHELFQIYDPKLPIVETIAYKSKVDWQPGRAAWISDYARHYETSRHFIARSLNGKKDYNKQDVSPGDRFNVFRKDKEINFHLVVDTQSCRMRFYYHDLDTNDLVLLKTYHVGLGRTDKSRASGLLTPLGRYSLGDKIAIYKPKTYAFHNGEKVEMIRVFGTRWIPFDQELGENTGPAKGFGIHGLPWTKDENGELVEDNSTLGQYQSDGCIRLSTEDVEEIFAIIITKPSFVQIVKGFGNAKLPGKEAF